ncbi:hypothetical protein Mame01_63350 [Microbispora amethystogenes]|uniref:DUF2637 domain-containing protein n=1 Tax=Microbispora sp. H10885 TaxID=2729110 RepID=UPI0016008247|nr:DUF2637 domain-containing protein [Microbispora sp. H10885]GLW26293.1 hypothetical protein Mame01_63350 [Microbispora amethystogenes]
MSLYSRVDACTSWTTTASVGLLAVIAAVVSYRQIHELALRQGESELGAALVPLAVDGMIVASSMSILLASQYGSRGRAERSGFDGGSFPCEDPHNQELRMRPPPPQCRSREISPTS